MLAGAYRPSAGGRSRGAGRLGSVSSDPSRWSLQYAFGLTPWDLGAPHPGLVARLDTDPGLGVVPSPGRVLVPGCGRGHDALAFLRAGWDVVAVDFAAQAVLRATELLGAEARVVEADVFDWEPDGPFDLLFDHTFFCTIPPEARDACGDLARRVVRVGGGVVSIVYPIGKCPPDAGPPYALEVADVDAALGGGFVRVETSEPMEEDPRRWEARWVRWERAVTG